MEEKLEIKPSQQETSSANFNDNGVNGSQSKKLKFKCSYSNCGQYFADVRTMRVHNLEEHCIFRCGICSDAFETLNQLRKHIKAHSKANKGVQEMPPPKLPKFEDPKRDKPNDERVFP